MGTTSYLIQRVRTSDQNQQARQKADTSDHRAVPFLMPIGRRYQRRRRLSPSGRPWRHLTRRQTSRAGQFQSETTIKHHSNHHIINCGVVRSACEFQRKPPTYSDLKPAGVLI